MGLYHYSDLIGAPSAFIKVQNDMDERYTAVMQDI